MEGLYKKVIRGLYPRIPPNYSSDLSNVIRCMLQILPDLRPTAEKILTITSVTKWVGELINKE
jgi:NIMA (never in mitosis gene a)-related kinase